MPTAAEFREELYRVIYEATKPGRAFVDINAGELHARLGAYPSRDHRIPVCCRVMKRAMAVDAGDRILQQPTSGEGATVTIRYVLPRSEKR